MSHMNLNGNMCQTYYILDNLIISIISELLIKYINFTEESKRLKKTR